MPPPGGFPNIVTEPPAPPTIALPIVTAGIWIPLLHQAPDDIHLMLLLSDGTVMAKGFAGGGDGIGNAWYKLTPDANGNYVTGTWSTRAPMQDTRLYFSSQVLKDGKVFIAGGEYPRNVNNGILGRATAEIYDPVTNSWTRIDPPTSVLDPSMLSPSLHPIIRLSSTRAARFFRMVKFSWHRLLQRCMRRALFMILPQTSGRRGPFSLTTLVIKTRRHGQVAG